MNIALLGYGKMGKMIERISYRHDMEVVAKYWDENLLEVNDQCQEELKDVSVMIDFSVPEAAYENIEKAAALKKNLVMGTTSWMNRLDDAKKIIEDSGIGFVYASNFSLGVNLFYRIVEYAGQLMASFDAYDPYIEEAHHQFKKDAPSGTGIVLQEKLQNSYKDHKTIPVTSVRAGYIPGEHRIGFDSLVDTIQMSHTARSREGFAEGSLIAAKWIAGKTGFYPFEDVINDILSQ